MRKNPLLLGDFFNSNSELWKWINKICDYHFLIIFKAEKKHWVYLISNKKEVLEKVGVKPYSVGELFTYCIRLSDYK